MCKAYPEARRPLVNSSSPEQPLPAPFLSPGCPPQSTPQRRSHCGLQPRVLLLPLPVHCGLGQSHSSELGLPPRLRIVPQALPAHLPDLSPTQLSCLVVGLLVSFPSESSAVAIPRYKRLAPHPHLSEDVPTIRNGVSHILSSPQPPAPVATPFSPTTTRGRAGVFPVPLFPVPPCLPPYLLSFSLL